eukprot:TRINITY_DN1192_c1_g1_i2.p1 TRINITY_DN1192_c1_g1~~TRINITY_DN1192_c1_g1_i2.p1  ORF type:complete len:340 (+),score=24.47 TRINITY_DN1192_c1_g1_i2:79-1098(+)
MNGARLLEIHNYQCPYFLERTKQYSSFNWEILAKFSNPIKNLKLVPPTTFEIVTNSESNLDATIWKIVVTEIHMKKLETNKNKRFTGALFSLMSGKQKIKDLPVAVLSRYDRERVAKILKSCVFELDQNFNLFSSQITQIFKFLLGVFRVTCPDLILEEIESLYRIYTIFSTKSVNHFWSWLSSCFVLLYTKGEQILKNGCIVLFDRKAAEKMLKKQHDGASIWRFSSENSSLVVSYKELDSLNIEHLMFEEGLDTHFLSCISTLVTLRTSIKKFFKPPNSWLTLDDLTGVGEKLSTKGRYKTIVSANNNTDFQPKKKKTQIRFHRRGADEVFCFPFCY